MSELSLSQATSSNLTDRVKDYEVSSLNTDGVQDQEETEYTNSKWPLYWGYFNSIAEVKSAIIMKAIWNVGKGYTANPETTVILDHVKGIGKDSFLEVLFNMEVIKRVGGDAFAEIIRDDDGTLLNLKPLDPGSMKIVVDRKGMLKRYEQINKLPNGKTSIVKFLPDDIFHLANNRLADQIHGISDILSMEKIILADAESFDDIKKIMHRSAKPMIMFKLGTDDQSKIDVFIKKMDEATNKGENIYIPDDKNYVSFEVVQVDVSANVMAWRDDMRNKFYRAVGMPQILFGSAGTTESGGKMEYLAHETVFEKDQKFLEQQIWNQLQLRIKLIPPTTLLDNLQQDQAKDANQGMEMQPNDMTAGTGR